MMNAPFRVWPSSTIQPGRGEAPAVIVAEVGAVVLQRGVPDGEGNDRIRLRPIDLLAEVALNVVDDLSALGDLPHPSLTQDQVGEGRIVDLQDVARAVGQV